MGEIVSKNLDYVRVHKSNIKEIQRLLRKREGGHTHLVVAVLFLITLVAIVGLFLVI